MKILNTLSLSLLLATVSNAALAEGFYGAAMAGGSFQANSSKPYGNNIAADPDFPGQFDTGDGAIGAINLGYVFNQKFRLEGRLALRNSDFSSEQTGTGARAGEQYILDGSIRSTSLTIEAFYDIPTSTTFKPYIKAGVGASRNTYEARLGGAGVAAFDRFDGTTDGFYDAYSDGKSTDLTWNVGIGASYPVGNRLSLFAEYQYVSIGDVQTGQDDFTDGFGVDSASHELLVGIRVNF